MEIQKKEKPMDEQKAAKADPSESLAAFLMQKYTPEIDGNIYYTDEELAIIRRMYGDYRTPEERDQIEAQKREAAIFNTEFKPYMSNVVSADIWNQNRNTVMGNTAMDQLYDKKKQNAMDKLMTGSGMEGGNIAGMILGAIPKLIPMIPQIVSTVKGLFGMGYTNGTGLRAPNEYAVHGYGKQYYKSMIKSSQRLLKDVTGAGKATVKAEFYKHIPKSFVKAMKSKQGKNKTTTKHNAHDNYSLARPIVKYYSNRMGLNNDEYHQLKTELKNSGDMGLEGGAPFSAIFGKVKNWMSDSISKVDPFVRRMVDQYGDVALQNLPKVVNMISDKFGKQKGGMAPRQLNWMNQPSPAGPNFPVAPSLTTTGKGKAKSIVRRIQVL